MCFTRTDKVTPLLRASGIFTRLRELTVNDCLWSPAWTSRHSLSTPCVKWGKKNCMERQTDESCYGNRSHTKMSNVGTLNCHLFEPLKQSTHRVDLWSVNSRREEWVKKRFTQGNCNVQAKKKKQNRKKSKCSINSGIQVTVKPRRGRGWG